GRGSIRLLGEDLEKLSAARRDHFRVDHTGYIFQQFNLLPFLSVRENVELPCHFSALRRQRARERHGSPAQAAIGQPELVIADEPTSALDADSREAFLQLLFAECREAGASLLFVSHDQSLAGLFDRSLSLSDLNRAARPAGL
ncbi:ABC transporter ATP-binding protein, partial [Pseudomonas aeruginosa]|nr:ABC transporter ATP-binding protein [Pseudomonas aeruginosa]